MNLLPGGGWMEVVGIEEDWVNSWVGWLGGQPAKLAQADMQKMV